MVRARLHVQLAMSINSLAGRNDSLGHGVLRDNLRFFSGQRTGAAMGHYEIATFDVFYARDDGKAV